MRLAGKFIVRATPWIGIAIGMAAPAFAAIPGSPGAPPLVIKDAPPPVSTALQAPDPDSTTPTDEASVESKNFVALQNRYVDLFKQFRSAVVHVNAATSAGADAKTTQINAWSGFFVSKNGYVLTSNANLLQQAQQQKTNIWIEQDGVSYAAEVTGCDLVTNLALLHLLKLPKDGTYVPIDITQNSEPLPVGSLLLAVTCQMDQSPGPSAGMLQGYPINYDHHALPTAHMLVNIPDDLGESGSPVFDLQGRFAGIMIASLPKSNSSLVLPAKAAARVREDFLDRGKVAYGHLGFEAQAISETDAGMSEVITNISYGGPAQVAGLKTDDVLLSISETPIHNDEDLQQVLFFTHPGQYVTVTVRRGNQEKDFPLEVGELPPPNPTATSALPVPLNAPILTSSNNFVTPASGTTSVTPPPEVEVKPK
jgi:S1-C subfamily serine protease